MDALFLAELNERLFTHFVGGLWRAPAGQRHLAVMRADGGRFGRIVCAEATDIARARASLDTAGPPAPAEAMRAAIRAHRDALMQLRAAEGFAEGFSGDDPATFAPGAPCEPGPQAVLSAASLPLGVLADLLIAGAQGGGLIWKPAPGAAASAHLLMRVLGPLAAGRLVMVQGDHASGALLAGAAPLVWASPAPVPEALPRPVFRLSDLRPSGAAQGRP